MGYVDEPDVGTLNTAAPTSPILDDFILYSLSLASERSIESLLHPLLYKVRTIRDSFVIDLISYSPHPGTELVLVINASTLRGSGKFWVLPNRNVPLRILRLKKLPLGMVGISMIIRKHR